MKRASRVFLPALAIAVFVFAPVSFAQSVSGGFHATTDGGDRDVELNAKIHPNGSASGDLKFKAPLSIPDQDVDGDGTGDPTATNATVSLRVDIDCVKVDGNRAAVSGVVKDASVSAYIGRRMLLTVEDGGEGKNAAPDRYTWGQYNTATASWVAADAELPFDPGVGLSWLATDAERTDDVGIPSNQPASVDCKSFPLSSYSLEDLPQGSGNIQVKP